MSWRLGLTSRRIFRPPEHRRVAPRDGDRARLVVAVPGEVEQVGALRIQRPKRSKAGPFLPFIHDTLALKNIDQAGVRVHAAHADRKEAVAQGVARLLPVAGRMHELDLDRREEQAINAQHEMMYKCNLAPVMIYRHLRQNTEMRQAVSQVSRTRYAD